MYTHMKQKHYYETNTGDQQPRGRGRPRKSNVATVVHGRPTFNPETDSYFKHPDSSGGPTCPMTGFDEIWAKLNQDIGRQTTDCGFKDQLMKFSASETPGRPIEENADTYQDEALKNEYVNLTEE